MAEAIHLKLYMRRVIGVFRFISLSLLLNLSLLNLNANAERERSPKAFTLNEQSVKRLNQDLIRAQKRLLNTLIKLDAAGDLMERESAFLLNDIFRSLKTTHEVARLYHQSERSPSLQQKHSFPEYHQLRRRVLSLVDEREALFDRVDGRLCLRPRWARLIAETAQRLKQIKLSTEYWMRAYSCHGLSSDLEAAKNLERSSVSKVSER